MSKIIISPSILSADFANLGQNIKSLELAGANWIHIDIMDGHFVPNISFGSIIVNSIRNYTKLPFDVHLMISDAHKYIEEFVKAGADIISIHVEIKNNLNNTIQLIKSFNKKVGIVLNPNTPANAINHIIDDIDLILIMGVNPGFGGQNFLYSQLIKIKEVRRMIGNRNILLAVDGGVNFKVIKLCHKFNVDVFVVGNAIFNSKNKDFKENIAILRK